MKNTARDRRRKPRFSEGDRVTRNFEGRMNVMNQFMAKEKKQKIYDVINDYTEGTIRQVTEKQNRVGAVCYTYEVQWDGSTSLSNHAQQRLMPVKSNLSVFTAEPVNTPIEKKPKVTQTEKPKAAKEVKAKVKSKNKIEIINFESFSIKELITAKVEKGFKGCIVTKNYICISKLTADNFLKAANAARTLKTKLGAHYVKESFADEALKKRVEIKNLDCADIKELSTARTEEGFIGCYTCEQGYFLTREPKKTVLEAGNAARKLKALVTKKTKPEGKERQTKQSRAAKLVVRETTKKVNCKQKIYSQEETLVMPLLSFQEVWVVTKDGEFVSDCLNKKTKKLVTFTKKRDNAKYFTCHEEAKRIVRVLKGTVGPGFNLRRFWIENK